MFRKNFSTKRFKIALKKKRNNFYVNVFYYMNIKFISDGTPR